MVLMPYKVVFRDYGDGWKDGGWSEPNKDEVITRLLWLLQQHGYDDANVIDLKGREMY